MVHIKKKKSLKIKKKDKKAHPYHLLLRLFSKELKLLK